MTEYKDPLHIPSSELVVEYYGEEVMLLNKRLLDQQNAWGNLQLLKDLHWERIRIERTMPKLDANKTLLLEQWTENQFALQRAWGFPEDAKFHRFWDIPSCGCPKMDNNDAYPTGYYTKSAACILHRHQLK